MGRPTIMCGFELFFFQLLLGKPGQFDPVPGHVEKENPAIDVGQVSGQLDAVGRVKPIAGDGLASRTHFPRHVPMRLLTSG